jgi:glycine cleavage system H protein
MQVGDYELRDDLSYDRNNNWIKIEGDTAIFGITDVGAKRAKEIAYIEMPKKGDKLEMGKACGQLESAKWAGEIVAPLSGEVIDVNESLSDNPGLINQDPYGSGWIAKIKLGRLEEGNSLMDVNSAAEWVKTQVLNG